MIFNVGDNFICGKEASETIRIEAWGKNALRVRATVNGRFSGEDHALDAVTTGKPEIGDCENGKYIKNGKISCVLSRSGWLEFFRDGVSVLREYGRNFRIPNRHSPCMNYNAREYKALGGNDYAVKLRFESRNGEKLFGMGQYQQPELDVKGCVLELVQRNSQISIPFCLSSLGYGFLWNNPCMGEVMFGKNYTEWFGKMTEEIDYWITADDTPKKILENYTGVTGRAPRFPENLLGLWQCKLRYRTQEEVLSVAREYKRRNIPIDVIVIDFFHWVRQGDWDFDPEYWPDPKGMVDELKKMGIRCMVSVWPTVDRKSKHFKEMQEKGLLLTNDHGTAQGMFFAGDAIFADSLNPETRAYMWEKISSTYGKYGIDMFWLDVCEPEYTDCDFEHYRHYTGQSAKVGNEYPKATCLGFYENMKRGGQKDVVNLSRCAWAGSQKYGALVWSGDVRTTFECLRDQLSAGLNMGLAGIPWWTTDTGGFHGSVTEDGFNELLVRWFEFSTFSPVLRMHGCRSPQDIPQLSNLDYGGGFMHTGRPNELWSYGEDVYNILKKYLDIRLSMKDYIASLYAEASANGSPLLRTMFYEFPDDPKCWELDDQYMFGSSYLVAPVLYRGVTERNVYLPDGKWKNIHSGETFGGGREITVAAPLDVIPVFEKIG